MSCKALQTTVCLGMLFIACNAMAQSPNCQIPRFSGAMDRNGAVTTMNVVNNGQPCGVDLYGGSRGSHPASRGVITNPPKHGHAEFVGPHIQYTPASGYVGADEFSGKAWAQNDNMVPKLLKLQIKVTVSAPQ